MVQLVRPLVGDGSRHVSGGNHHMARRPSAFTAALATAAALVLMAGPVTPASAATAPPADGTAYFGVFLGSGDTPADYVSRSGLRPAQYGQFAHLPMPDAEKQSLSAEVE